MGLFTALAKLVLLVILNIVVFVIFFPVNVASQFISTILTLMILPLVHIINILIYVANAVSDILDNMLNPFNDDFKHLPYIRSDLITDELIIGTLEPYNITHLLPAWLSLPVGILALAFINYLYFNYIVKLLS